MADLLPRLTSVVPSQHSSDESYDHDIRELIAYIKDPRRKSSIIGSCGYLLENLDPSVHTISYLLVLHYYIQYQKEADNARLWGDFRPGGSLWQKAVQFLNCFDPIQIRYIGREWRLLVELVAQAAQEISKPILAVSVIADALLRVDANSEVFTSVHLLVIRLALLSRSYTSALPILDKQQCHFPCVSGQIYQKHHQPPLCSNDTSSTVFITDISGFSSKLTYKDHLQYYLFGAMIYLALKKLDTALHFLSIVISSPAGSSVSKIMVEAYKKWVLTSLLAHGKTINPPKVISSSTMRIYQTLSKPYGSLADAFEKGDLNRLKSEFEVGQSVWRTDNNLGLVSQVIVAFDRYMVMKLGKKFSALSIPDVSQQVVTSVGTEHSVIETLIATQIMSGALDATLLHQDDSQSTMLRFSSAAVSPISREQSVQARLLEEIRVLKLFANSTGTANYALDLSDEHLRFVQKNQRWADDGDKGNNVSRTAGGSFEVDEDIMGDIH
ncbi:COP9 signalosome complex subunit 3 [Aspergillus ambiguus]|uniref:putative COP9 subunit 3 n=1 Tax=Aspergillus ambiguus TaxID=176160 RepID=UPI003CCD8988